MKVGDKLICYKSMTPFYNYIKGNVYTIELIKSINGGDIVFYYINDSKYNRIYVFSLSEIDKYFYCIREQRKLKLNSLKYGKSI